MYSVSPVAVAGQDPSLVTWFRADSITAADGSPVATWTDSTGDGFNASQGTASRRPTYVADAIDGHPAVHFNAASSTQFAFARPVSGDFTITVVFRSTQGIGNGSDWYSGAGLVDGDVTGAASDFGTSLNAAGQVLAGTGQPDTSVASGLAFNDGRPHVLTFTRAASSRTLSLYVDGKLYQQSTSAGSQALTSASRLTIGSLQTNLNYFTGDIADVRVYSAVLSTAARTAAEASLESTYDIAPPPTSTFANPVINADFPDPGVLKVGNTYYAYATNSGGRNVQEERSTDLVHWSQLAEALPTLPSWAQAGRTWAPYVAKMANGLYDMYYTAWSKADGHQHIGVATSSTPTGPFTPAGSAPLVDQGSLGGAIDASEFTDTNGTQYLVWKNDGNAVGQTTTLWAQQLSTDGLSLIGSPTPLAQNDQAWEGSVVEAPELLKHNGLYYLFYSANNYATNAYAIGYAVSSSVLGAYAKAAGPWVSTTANVIGPGGETFTVGSDGNTWMLYHSWQNNFAYRAMSADELTWNGNTPVLRGPSRALQPIPQAAVVAGRYTFYNDSSFDAGTTSAADDPAVATDKQALLPGQTATFANYTSYVDGINGVMVDVRHDLSSAPANVTAADFTFRVGNDNDPSAWATAPAPSTVRVRVGAGVNGTDRIEVTWPDGSIQKQWLQVTALANADTGLATPDVFYFGNAVGETGNNAGNAIVDGGDEIAARNNRTGLTAAAITNAYDFNRDGRVDGSDEIIARNNRSGLTPLRLITPTVNAAAPALAAATPTTIAVVPTGIRTKTSSKPPTSSLPPTTPTAPVPPPTPAQSVTTTVRARHRRHWLAEA